MKVDFHFHLEEGPYSFAWLQRTTKALRETSLEGEGALLRHSLPWMEQALHKLQNRLHTGCFGKDWIERYIRVGLSRGIEKFGVVDHLYRFVEFKPYYERFMLLDDSVVGRLQRIWLDQVCVYSIEQFLEVVQHAAGADSLLSVGVEADYFAGGEDQLSGLLSHWQLDYVIGSVHFYEGWGFDNPDVQERFHKIDLTEMYRNHFDTVKRAIASGLFDFIAHLDNLKVFGFRPEEAELLQMYKDVADALRSSNMATEINTGLLYRYPVKEMCPSPTFLQILYDHGVPITLSSDAHFPDDIGMHLEKAIQAAGRAGYKEIVYFQNRKRHVVPL